VSPCFQWRLERSFGKKNRGVCVLLACDYLPPHLYFRLSICHHEEDHPWGFSLLPDVELQLRTSAEDGARALLLHQSNDDLSLAGLTADHLMTIDLDLDSSPLPFLLALGRVFILSRTRTYEVRNQEISRNNVRESVKDPY
jgi:hypothetical protein